MSKRVRMKIWVDPVDPETDEVHGLDVKIADIEWERTYSRTWLIQQFVRHQIGDEIEQLLRQRWLDEAD